MATPRKIFFYVYDGQAMLFLALLFVGICYYLKLVWKKRYLVIKSWNYPGPFNVPLIGIPYYLICKRDDLLKKITNLQKKYPTGGKTWFGNILAYYLHEPEHIRKILGNSKLVTKEHIIYKTFKIDNREGIFSAPPEKWKKNRKIIVASFNQQILNSFVEVFARKSLILNKILYENYSQELDFENIFARCAFDMTCEPLKRLVFLDHIMKSEEFSEEQITTEVQTLLVGATHTSANALVFVLAVLGMFPDIQQKVFEEVTKILGNDRSPEVTDLPHMIYTEMVIKETLRVFPVIPFFVRAITEDVDMGDFVVPKGASACFGLLFIHRNPKYWPDPLKFDPDRFLPEEIAKRHPCTFIPFSYGPRNCIGIKYGMMSMKVIIATVIRKFIIHCEYKKIEDIRVKLDFVLKFQDGAKVSVKPRH